MKKLLLILFLTIASFSEAAKIITVTSNTTTTADEQTVLCNASGGAVTITLVDCRSNTKVIQVFKKIDNSANACTLDGTGSQTIDGAATFALIGERNAAVVQCDGANWQIHSGPFETITGGVAFSDLTGSATDAQIPDTITINGTDNVSLGSIAGSTDDSVLVNSGSAWQEKTIPDCDTATTSKLLYDQATNAWSCGTDQDSGAGSIPFIGAKVSRSTAQSIATATVTELTADTETEDTSAFHSTASLTDRIVFNTEGAGVYTLTCTLEFATGSTGYRQGFIVLNDATVVGNARHVPSSVTSTIFTVIAENIRISTPASDYIECKANHTQGANLNVGLQSFTVRKVGT